MMAEVILSKLNLATQLKETVQRLYSEWLNTTAGKKKCGEQTTSKSVDPYCTFTQNFPNNFCNFLHH